MNEGTPLGEFVEGRIYYGLKTGLNEAFVIDQDKRVTSSLGKTRAARISSSLWLRGRDIKRWKTDWAGLYVIHVPWSLDISMYPAVEQHLAWFRGKTRKQARALDVESSPGSRCLDGVLQYHEQFANTKIVWGNLAPVEFA